VPGRDILAANSITSSARASSVGGTNPPDECGSHRPG
jgi:hypothetical protein